MVGPKHRLGESMLLVLYCLEVFWVKKPGGEQRQVVGGPVEACSGSRSREATYRTRGFTDIQKRQLIAEVTQKFVKAESSIGVKKAGL